MRRIDPIGVPAGEFKSATAGFLAHPEEANRLVKAFLRISSPGRRNAVLEFVADMARVEDVERSTRTPD